MTLPREIKFRAWHKGHEYAPAQMIYDKNPGDCLVWKLQGQNIEDIMQYTGWKDDREVEVYEGDTVILIITGEVYTVFWDTCGSGFLFGDGEVAVDYYEFEEKCAGFGFRVIGNAYESKEESQ